LPILYYIEKNTELEFNLDGVGWAIYLTLNDNFFLQIKLYHEKKGQLVMLWIHQHFTEKEHPLNTV